MKIKNNKQASLILLSLLLVWFLLVLSTGILKVILSDAKDTYWMKNSLKAFYWAESWLELALLRLKLKWFWYNYEIKNDWKKEVNVLASDFEHPKNNKDIFLDYKIESKSKSASWTIESGQSVIYPLFYKTWASDFSKGSIMKDLSELELILTPWTQSGSSITWWIIWSPKSWINIKWLNWTWEGTNEWITKYLDEATKKLVFASWSVDVFLSNHTWSYLQIWNLNTWDIKYEIKWKWTQNNFTWKQTIITASARVWKNKQNIQLKINNSKYLNIFRFTLYDPWKG